MKIGPIKIDEPITLTQFQNGGWVVTQGPAGIGVVPQNLGAYTNSKDLIDALSDALIMPDDNEF